MKNLPHKISNYWKNGKQGKLIIILLLVVVVFLICICCAGLVITGYAIGTSPSKKTIAIAEEYLNQTFNPLPTLTPIETVTPAEEEESTGVTSNPCESLGEKYKHDEELGEITEDYIGSWHASPSVGSGYNERFVFFSSGNYLFFPSQYECDFGDESCTPSPIEEGTWGVQNSQINLAIEGDIHNIRSILIGKVIDSPDEESPYPLKTTFDGTTYWLMSKDTNMWNPQTGELCD